MPVAWPLVTTVPRGRRAVWRAPTDLLLAPFGPGGGARPRDRNLVEAWATLRGMTGLIDRPVNWVALAGFMGTGKSRIGWELSRALALHFVDTDKLIQRVTNRTVPEVFEQEGEAAFRAYEREVVRRVCRLEYAVVSLGGGTFIQPENRAALLSRGPVVVLWATPETVLRRTQHSDRPLLKAADPLERITSLMAERRSAYQEGTIHVTSDGRESAEVVAEVIERLWQWAEADDADWDTAPEAVPGEELHAKD